MYGKALVTIHSDRLLARRCATHLLIGCVLALGACAADTLAVKGTGNALSYVNGARDMAPIPLAERALPTAMAEPFFKVSDVPFAIEGPSFDRQGNLYFLDVYSGRVLRLTPEGQLSTVYTDKSLAPAGSAVHKDGRLFLAGVGNLSAGSVVAINPDGGNPQTIVPASAGYVPDDLVFDDRGGIYFTDFRGTVARPTGGLFYVSSDYKDITPVLPNMAMANGVALSPDGKSVWATEFSAGRLHRGDLGGQGKIARAFVPYHFIGQAPDSMRTDVDGNVYVAMTLQGRILVFNANGTPVGQIVLPGRENGRFLRVTSLAFVPGSSDMVIVSRDEGGPGGTMIFKAQGLAKGTTLYSHQ
jgi:lactonase